MFRITFFCIVSKCDRAEQTYLTALSMMFCSSIRAMNRSRSDLQIILKLYNYKFLLKRLFLMKKFSVNAVPCLFFFPERNQKFKF